MENSEETQVPLPDDWDPEPARRAYYKNSVSGDWGWLVRREGNDVIKLDRPGVDEIRRFDPGEWQPRDAPKPLQPAHLAMVAYQADKTLCRVLGGELMRFTKGDWLDLSQEQRRAWIEKGPPTHPDRRALYAAIMGALGHLASR